MAIALLGSVATGNDETVGTTQTLAHTLVAGSERVVVITTGRFNFTPRTVSGVTYGGVTATPIHNIVGSDTAWCIAQHYVKDADLPADGANNAVITYSGNVDNSAMVIEAHSGVDQANPIGDKDSRDGTAGDTGGTLTLTTVSGDWALCGLLQSADAPTKNAGDVDIGAAVADADTYLSYEEAGGASTTVGWTVSSQANIIIGTVLQLAVAAGGAGTTSNVRAG